MPGEEGMNQKRVNVKWWGLVLAVLAALTLCFSRLVHPRPVSVSSKDATSCSPPGGIAAS